MRRITRLAAVAGVCLLGVPAVASADNLAVQVGGEVKNKPWIDLQGIYPKMPVVHVGDTIDFSIVGFHTIAVQPNGTTGCRSSPRRAERSRPRTMRTVTRSGGAASSTRSA